MSDTENTKTRPTHIIWMVTGTGAGFWTRIGAGWQKQSGKISLRLDCVPLADARILLKEVSDDDQSGDRGDTQEPEAAADQAAAPEGKRKGGQK